MTFSISQLGLMFYLPVGYMFSLSRSGTHKNNTDYCNFIRIKISEL